MRRIFFLLLAACGTRTDLGGQVASQSQDAAIVALQGVVHNSCSPNDGLEINFDLVPSGAPLPTCVNPAVGQGGFRIVFWSPIPNTPGDYTIGEGSAALYCPGSPDQCVTAIHGTVTITEYTDATASGAFTLVLPDHTTIAGTFVNTPLCNNPIMCG